MLGLFSDCKTMVKYSGTSIEIATFKGPVRVPVSISGVGIKPQLLQAAGPILQILDWLQFSGCQRIHELKKLKGIPQKTIVDLILRQDEDFRRIASLAMISIAQFSSAESFEKVLADWIAAAYPRARQLRRSAISPREKEKEKELLDRLKKIENQTRNVEEEIEHLTAQLQEMKLYRRRLKKEKNELQLLSKEMLMGFEVISAYEGIVAHEVPILVDLEGKLSEAISVFPYLSQAIQKNEPFDIEKSLKDLTENR